MSSPETPSHNRICEMAIAILRATEDGDRLSPDDLRLLEHALNGALNASGIALLETLYSNATKPAGYTTPQLFGIEHLTIDQERYIRWRGRVVEHFDHGFWRKAGWRERMRRDAEALAAYCCGLESQGIEPTSATVAGWSLSPQKDREDERDR